MKLRFYGYLADMMGRELEIDSVTSCTIEQLRRQVSSEHDPIGEALENGRVRVCVGDAIVHDDYIVGPDDTVEFLPPVSGG